LEELNKKLYGAEMSFQALNSEALKQRAAAQKALEPPEQIKEEVVEVIEDSP